MNNLDRLELIDRIGRELQSRMTFTDIDVYLRGHGVDIGHKTSGINSKWVYVKELLADEPADTVLRIATELGVPHNYVVTSTGLPTESTFWKPGYFRLFLSHLATFKKQTTSLQQVLQVYGISSFVAHVDIEPTREWMQEIEIALRSMDAMAAIVMPGFKESNWTDQEVGIAIGLDRLVIPVIRGLDPYGFLGKYQGLRVGRKTVGQVAAGLFGILGASPKTHNRLVSALTGMLATESQAGVAMQRLTYLKSLALSQAEVAGFRQSVSSNGLFIAKGSELRTAADDFFADHALPPLEPEDEAVDEEDFDDFPF